MFLGMQDFDFAHVESNCPNLITFAQISLQSCLKFSSILSKFCLNLINFAKI